jgi:hypothetical protein
VAVELNLLIASEMNRCLLVLGVGIVGNNLQGVAESSNFIVT